MRWVIAHAVILLFLSPIVSMQYFNKIIKRESLQIFPGGDSCISDCSPSYQKASKKTHCSIVECESPESMDIAQASEIDNTKDIYFEIFTDKKDGQKKLALRVGWSPVDNVSLEKTTGYMITISDGNATYSTCYSITSPMSFPDNSKDIYYNNCFGKTTGTHVTPGTEISVNITTLPLWSVDHSYGTATRIIQVPDCTNVNLFPLQECERPGGAPTVRPCISTSCNTKSHMNDQAHHINCSLSQFNFTTLESVEKCDDVNRPVNGTPSAPMRVQREQEWYKYIDDRTGEVKIALNFTWMPSPDSSIESIHFYYLEVMPMSIVTTVYVNKCYAIHTALERSKHMKALFYYDCYGRDRGSSTVQPGHQYLVHIQSRPVFISDPRSSTQFLIQIPGCDDERLGDVTTCQENMRTRTEAKVTDIYCRNNSIQFSYDISHEKGKTADIFFCAISDDSWDCDADLSPKMQNLELANTLYNVSFRSELDKNTNICIVIQGHDGANRVYTFFNFSNCTAAPALDITLIVTIPIVSVICFVVVVFLVCYFSRKCTLTKDFLARCNRLPERAVAVNVLNGHSNSNQDTRDGPPTMPSNLRVYVVFMDDHELHRNVVHWFCAYLKQDLGLDVRVQIWQPAEVAVNQISYMKNNMRLADKVVIICSEGTKHCMEKTDYNGDMFTPVIREVSQNAFLGKSPGKFLVGYFPYSSPSNVPELLHDQCLIYFSLFKLMKQFEQFYFRLVGIEQFQQGAIYRIEKIAFDRYFEPGLTTCGMKLKEAIDRMVEFVEKCPTWYTDNQGSDLPGPNLPSAPSFEIAPPSTTEYSSILKEVPGQASIRYITAKPPPNISDGYVHAKFDNVPDSSKPQNPVSSNPTKEVPSYRIRNPSKTSSFILPETDYETLSSFSQASNSIPGEEYYGRTAGRAYSTDYSESNQPLFLAESFNDHDFNGTDLENFSLEYSPPNSNITQVTTLDLSVSKEKLVKCTEGNDIISLHTTETSGPQPSPESGVFNLANIENSVENFEDEFRSINLTQV